MTTTKNTPAPSVPARAGKLGVILPNGDIAYRATRNHYTHAVVTDDGIASMHSSLAAAQAAKNASRTARRVRENGVIVAVPAQVATPRTRKAKDSDLVFVPGVGTVLPAIPATEWDAAVADAAAAIAAAPMTLPALERKERAARAAATRAAKKAAAAPEAQAEMARFAAQLPIVEPEAPAAAAPAAAPRKRESLKNADRRNETTHVDGAEAVAAFTCEAPGCGSVPGVRCLAATGKATSYVHGSRMRQLDAFRAAAAAGLAQRTAARKAGK